MTSLLERNAEEALRGIDAKPLAGKAVLLTGATGLIGVNLAAALTRAGARLTTPKRSVPVMGTYDYIVHAAGYAQPSRFLADPMATIAVNTSMLVDLIGRMKPDGRLLFLSTSEVYSGNPRGLHREDDIGATNPAHARG